MSEMLPRLPIPQGAVSDLDARRAMSSFRELMKLAKEKPEKAFAILQIAARDPEPYPDSYAAIYLLGQIAGVLAVNGDAWKLEALEATHKDMMDWKPEDYIGRRRKYARRS